MRHARTVAICIVLWVPAVCLAEGTGESPCWASETFDPNGRASSHARLQTALHGLTLDSPTADAALHFLNGDSRFVGVFGFTVSYPGIDPVEDAELFCIHGGRPVPGTTDAVEGPEHQALIERVRQYAAAYNARMRALITRDEEDANEAPLGRTDIRSRSGSSPRIPLIDARG